MQLATACGFADDRATAVESFCAEVYVDARMTLADSSKRLRGRILLRNADTGALTYLLWVELRGRDFYWGSPGPAPDMPSVRSVPGETWSYTVPDNFRDLPTASMKTSVHESGVTHVTTDGSGAQALADTYVGPITSFREPTMFAAMYTAAQRGHGLTGVHAIVRSKCV